MIAKLTEHYIHMIMTYVHCTGIVDIFETEIAVSIILSIRLAIVLHLSVDMDIIMQGELGPLVDGL